MLSNQASGAPLPPSRADAHKSPASKRSRSSTPPGFSFPGAARTPPSSQPPFGALGSGAHAGAASAGRAATQQRLSGLFEAAGAAALASPAPAEGSGGAASGDAQEGPAAPEPAAGARARKRPYAAAWRRWSAPAAVPEPQAGAAPTGASAAAVTPLPAAAPASPRTAARARRTRQAAVARRNAAAVQAHLSRRRRSSLGGDGSPSLSPAAAEALARAAAAFGPSPVGGLVAGGKQQPAVAHQDAPSRAAAPRAAAAAAGGKRGSGKGGAPRARPRPGGCGGKNAEDVAGGASVGGGADGSAWPATAGSDGCALSAEQEVRLHRVKARAPWLGVGSKPGGLLLSGRLLVPGIVARQGKGVPTLSRSCLCHCRWRTAAPHFPLTTTRRPNPPAQTPPTQYATALAAALAPGSPGGPKAPAFGTGAGAQDGGPSPATPPMIGAAGGAGVADVIRAICSSGKKARPAGAPPVSPGPMVAEAAHCYGAPATPFTAVAAALGRLAVPAGGGGDGAGAPAAGADAGTDAAPRRASAPSSPAVKDTRKAAAAAPGAAAGGRKGAGSAAAPIAAAARDTPARGLVKCFAEGDQAGLVAAVASVEGGASAEPRG